MGLVQTMVGLSYIRMDEVPRIPTRTTPLRAAVYAPLAATPVPPDVVLVRGNPQQLMLLAEAAQAAGVAGSGPTLGRPTCAVLPEAINSTRTAASFGCIGNRVYTGAGDTEAYFAIPGAQLGAVEEKLAIVVRANQELEKFHRSQNETIRNGQVRRSGSEPLTPSLSPSDGERVAVRPGEGKVFVVMISKGEPTENRAPPGAPTGAGSSRVTRTRPSATASTRGTSFGMRGR
jgi:hypothetical protein